MAKPITKQLNLGSPQRWLKHCELFIGESLLDSGVSSDSEYANLDAILLHPESSINFEIQAVENKEKTVLKELEHFISKPWYNAQQEKITSQDWSALHDKLGHSIPMVTCALSYELGTQSKGVKAQDVSHSAPALWATRYKAVYIWLRHKHEGWLIATEQVVFDQIEKRITEAYSKVHVGKIQMGFSEQAKYNEQAKLNGHGLVPECTFEEYQQSFNRLQEAILDGEVYQMNLTVALKQHLRLCCDPIELFQQIWSVNSGQFSALLRLDQQKSLLSFSPERLVKWSRSNQQYQASWIETAPIKGTRPRRAQAQADIEELHDLQTSIKDRAEHVMILDLERNDLGQICKSGSVQVTQNQVARSYATVHHLVSVIKGELLDHVTLIDILAAVFPGGSVTGAPKKRAMDLIRELEYSPRGIYCGALGYFDPLGGGDLNLPIRTIFLDEDQVEYHSGGGIVADSSAQGEWDELWVKTKGFEKALFPKYDDLQ